MGGCIINRGAGATGKTGATGATGDVIYGQFCSK